MSESHRDASLLEGDLLTVLKRLQGPEATLDIQINGPTSSGLVRLAGGRIISASCGQLHGNGALMTLATMPAASLHRVALSSPMPANVSLTPLLLERLLATLKPTSGKAVVEHEVLEEAVRLFFQFRRKEAGAKLLEVLKANRFYYPAWLWHSRLMTRPDYIRKALAEARKWGNADPLVAQEHSRVEPLLEKAGATVRRCFFCWAPVDVSEDRCSYCGGGMRIQRQQLEPERPELIDEALSAYQRELLDDSRNARILYCICLGHCSLGNLEQARDFVVRALSVAPKEKLFLKTAAALGVEAPVPTQARDVKAAGQESVTPATAQSSQPVASPGVAVESVASLVKAPESGPIKGKTIMVVEDSPTARKVITMLLQRHGYSIVEAGTGGVTLDILGRMTPDLVVLDVMLPDITGYDVLASIRQEQRLQDIPVIMLTGRTGAADRMRGMMSGTNEYLTKPFDPAKLLAAIEKNLEGRSPQPQPTELMPQKQPGQKAALVVEDSLAGRTVAGIVLEKEGYRVEEVPTGREALALLEKGGIDLILLDAILPDMSGYGLLAHLKASEELCRIPVLLMASGLGAVEKERAVRAGARACLNKPVDSDQLRALLAARFD